MVSGMGSAPVELWDAEAAGFDDVADHGLREPGIRAAWRRILLDALPEPPARVADLGCGTGSLALLLAEQGFAVDGVDFSPAMVLRARRKTAQFPAVAISEGDVGAPGLTVAGYDVVLCRHVLWALPDPTTALRRWIDLLADGGRLVLIEGHWSTGAGLTGDEIGVLLRGAGRKFELRPLDDPGLWGGAIADERYLVLSPPSY